MFRQGDRVSFTDKYGIAQTGTYEGMTTMPTADGTAVVALVRAKVFADMGDDSDINCLVSPSALRRAE